MRTIAVIAGLLIVVGVLARRRAIRLEERRAMRRLARRQYILVPDTFPKEWV